MSLPNHPVVLKKPCPLCTGKENKKWLIKHFNGRTDCPRYASCSCGGQFRCKQNQSIFYPPKSPVLDSPQARSSAGTHTVTGSTGQASGQHPVNTGQETVTVNTGQEPVTVTLVEETVTEKPVTETESMWDPYL